MSGMMKLAAVLFAGLLAFTANARAQSSEPARRAGIFEEGARAPALELPSIDGSATINLAALRGKKLIVLQFASW
jgi:hypothetical protein